MGKRNKPEQTATRKPGKGRGGGMPPPTAKWGKASRPSVEPPVEEEADDEDDEEYEDESVAADGAGELQRPSQKAPGILLSPTAKAPASKPRAPNIARPKPSSSSDSPQPPPGPPPKSVKAAVLDPTSTDSWLRWVLCKSPGAEERLSQEPAGTRKRLEHVVGQLEAAGKTLMEGQAMLALRKAPLADGIKVLEGLLSDGKQLDPSHYVLNSLRSMASSEEFWNAEDEPIEAGGFGASARSITPAARMPNPKPTAKARSGETVKALVARPKPHPGQKLAPAVPTKAVWTAQGSAAVAFWGAQSSDGDTSGRASSNGGSSAKISPAAPQKQQGLFQRQTPKERGSVAAMRPDVQQEENLNHRLMHYLDLLKDSLSEAARQELLRLGPAVAVKILEITERVCQTPEEAAQLITSRLLRTRGQQTAPKRNEVRRDDQSQTEEDREGVRLDDIPTQEQQEQQEQREQQVPQVKQDQQDQQPSDKLRQHKGITTAGTSASELALRKHEAAQRGLDMHSDAAPNGQDAGSSAQQRGGSSSSSTSAAADSSQTQIFATFGVKQEPAESDGQSSSVVPKPNHQEVSRVAAAAPQPDAGNASAGSGTPKEGAEQHQGAPQDSGRLHQQVLGQSGKADGAHSGSPHGHAQASSAESRRGQGGCRNQPEHTALAPPAKHTQAAHSKGLAQVGSPKSQAQEAVSREQTQAAHSEKQAQVAQSGSEAQGSRIEAPAIIKSPKEQARVAHSGSQAQSASLGGQSPIANKGGQAQATHKPGLSQSASSGGRTPSSNSAGQAEAVNFGGKAQKAQSGKQAQAAHPAGQTQQADASGKTQASNLGGQSQISSTGGKAREKAPGGQLQVEQSSKLAQVASSGSGGQAREKGPGEQPQVAQPGAKAQVASLGGQTQVAQPGAKAQVVQSGGQARATHSGGQAQLAEVGGKTQSVNSGALAHVSGSGGQARDKGPGGQPQVDQFSKRAHVANSSAPMQVAQAGAKQQVVQSVGQVQVVHSGGQAQLADAGGKTQLANSGGQAKVSNPGGQDPGKCFGGQPQVVPSETNAQISNSTAHAQAAHVVGQAQAAQSGVQAHAGFSGAQAQLGAFGGHAPAAHFGGQAQVNPFQMHAQMAHSGALAQLAHSVEHVQFGQFGGQAQANLLQHAQQSWYNQQSVWPVAHANLQVDPCLAMHALHPGLAWDAVTQAYLQQQSAWTHAGVASAQDHIAQDPAVSNRAAVPGGQSQCGGQAAQTVPVAKEAQGHTATQRESASQPDARAPAQAQPVTSGNQGSTPTQHEVASQSAARPSAQARASTSSTKIASHAAGASDEARDPGAGPTGAPPRKEGSPRTDGARRWNQPVDVKDSVVAFHAASTPADSVPVTQEDSNRNGNAAQDSSKAAQPKDKPQSSHLSRDPIAAKTPLTPVQLTGAAELLVLDYPSELQLGLTALRKPLLATKGISSVSIPEDGTDDKLTRKASITGSAAALDEIHDKISRSLGSRIAVVGYAACYTPKDESAPLRVWVRGLQDAIGECGACFTLMACGKVLRWVRRSETGGATGSLCCFESHEAVWRAAQFLEGRCVGGIRCGVELDEHTRKKLEAWRTEKRKAVGLAHGSDINAHLVKEAESAWKVFEARISKSPQGSKQPLPAPLPNRAVPPAGDLGIAHSAHTPRKAQTSKPQQQPQQQQQQRQESRAARAAVVAAASSVRMSGAGQQHKEDRGTSATDADVRAKTSSVKEPVIEKPEQPRQQQQQKPGPRAANASALASSASAKLNVGEQQQHKQQLQKQQQEAHVADAAVASTAASVNTAVEEQQRQQHRKKESHETRTSDAVAPSASGSVKVPVADRQEKHQAQQQPQQQQPQQQQSHQKRQDERGAEASGVAASVSVKAADAKRQQQLEQHKQQQREASTTSAGAHATSGSYKKAVDEHDEQRRAAAGAPAKLDVAKAVSAPAGSVSHPPEASAALRREEDLQRHVQQLQRSKPVIVLSDDEEERRNEAAAAAIAGGRGRRSSQFPQLRQHQPQPAPCEAGSEESPRQRKAAPPSDSSDSRKREARAQLREESPRQRMAPPPSDLSDSRKREAGSQPPEGMAKRAAVQRGAGSPERAALKSRSRSRSAKRQPGGAREETRPKEDAEQDPYMVGDVDIADPYMMPAEEDVAGDPYLLPQEEDAGQDPYM